MRIFLSWSDETSHAIARTLGEWIPSVIQAVEATVSPEDIRKEAGWANEVSKEMNRSSLGIICVVPGNVGAPWLNFEAGVLSKTLDGSKVIPLLIDVERSELDNGPLVQFPSAIFGKKEMNLILETINENMEKGSLSGERLRNTFEIWWPKLEMDVLSIMGKEIKKAEDADGPEESPDTEKPERKSDPEKPEEKPDGKSTDDRPEETPGRPVRKGGKSEGESTREPDKPKKSVAARLSLDELEIELLKVLYEPPGYTPRTAADVGYKLDISASKVKERLDILERKNYVREHLYVGRAKEFSLAPKGREYITKHNLLK